ncbi:MAG: hypothetical protein IJ194_03190 [Bacilli bacterium]|nr:hypothetical protein [Bacilli bacterium]
MAYINKAIEDTLKNRFETAKSVAITGARQVVLPFILNATNNIDSIDMDKKHLYSKR